KPWLKAHWPSVRETLIAGSYLPRRIRKVDIPKPNGGIRTLGIPTVVDRLIQQAIAQVLTPHVEPGFSHSSYGFRPNRNAWQAVRQAQQYIHSGKRWVVDMDLEKFFDRVNHDILMSRLARIIKDGRLLKLIRRYLKAEMVDEQGVLKRDKGMPQGGPLSPLLANVLLDEVDKALEQRGYRFARYADDCNVYVRSQKAGERVMAWLRRLYAKLRLQVNESKSAVGSVFGRKFLGYSLWRTRRGEVKRAVSEAALTRFKARIKQ
ncbi:MAG: group II intron reverse transcriptase/maturase, partial [Pseudomonas sp.]